MYAPYVRAAALSLHCQAESGTSPVLPAGRAPMHRDQSRRGAQSVCCGEEALDQDGAVPLPIYDRLTYQLVHKVDLEFVQAR